MRVYAGVAVPSSRPGLISGMKAGWSELRDCVDAAVLVGANVIASAIYGAFTVLFVLLSRHLGLGSSGYGYLLAGCGAGGVLSAGLAHRAAASAQPRRALRDRAASTRPVGMAEQIRLGTQVVGPPMAAEEA